MFGWLFKKVEKEEFNQHKSSVQTASNNVKQDISDIGEWIKHLHSSDSGIKSDVVQVMDEIATIKSDIEEIKEMISENQTAKIVPVFKQRQTAVDKQTAVYGVQTAVQTAVQAGFFTKLSVSEKSIVAILMNSDMKLSYEDLAAMMGKDTATIRGQVNSIKQKCNGLIEEQIEKNGKKRLYVPDNMRDLLLRKAKTRSKRRE